MALRINNRAFRPPQSSIDNFNVVWEYVGCSIDEVKYERNKIMLNFDEMDQSYRLMAEKIRNDG